MPYKEFDNSSNTLTLVSSALTNEFLSKCLSEWFKEPLTFTHWEFAGDTGKGDSYLSEIIRIKIYGNAKDTSKHVQVILKFIPKNVCRRLTFRSHDFFRNEIMFYRNVLPELLKFQEKKNIPEPFNNYVKLFLSHIDMNGVNDVISVEDVSLENFRSIPRQEGIDLVHCKVTLKLLAKYHALSFALRDQEPEIFNNISNMVSEVYYDLKYWDWYQRFWNRVCVIAIDAVEKEYPNTIYVNKIKKFAVPERYEEIVNAVRDRTNAVITHGDCWTSNFLYKYIKRTPIDAKLIDFQLARCTSPVLDLSFFIYACTDQKMRLTYYEDLLHYYYQSLSSQIKDLGSNPMKLYSWDSFMDEVKKYSFFGLVSSFEAIPFSVLSPEDALNMEMQGDEERNIDDFWTLQPFKTKEDRLREADIIVHCVDNGYI